MYTAAELLTFGLNRTLDPDWGTSEAGSAFTCMASGIERILKLTYGASHLESGKPFPSPSALRRLGHDLAGLDAVRPDLTGRATRAGKGYARRWCLWGAARLRSFSASLGGGVSARLRFAWRREFPFVADVPVPVHVRCAIGPLTGKPSAIRPGSTRSKDDTTGSPDPVT